MDSPMGLMSEEEIRQYFVKNGGMVRNTDIVNYFRHYLSNPTTRDESRVLFKTYVNKLATVKVENGDKFLVLKRQYFPPIDGNGNPMQQHSGMSSHPSGSALLNSYPSTGSLYAQQQSGVLGLPVPPPNPGYGGGGGYSQQVRRQSSQSGLYGSQFSLNSNYTDPYGNNNENSNMGMQTPSFYPASHYAQQQQGAPQLYPSQSQQGRPQYLPLQNYPNMNVQPPPLQMHNAEYPPEYGLPPVPFNSNANAITSPPRRFISPQNSFGNLNGNGGSPARVVPPPYRPPPPAGRFPATPPGSMHSNASGGLSRRSSMTSLGGGGGIPYHRTQSVPSGSGGGPSSYYSSQQNVNAGMEAPPGWPGMYQYNRSASVTGLPQAVSNSQPNAAVFSPGGAPPPPVPPRSRRSVERSPSAVTSYSISSPQRQDNHNLRGNRGLGPKKMEMNGDNAINGSGIQPQNGIASSAGTMLEHTRMQNKEHADNNGMMDAENEKENINNLQISDNLNHIEHGGNGSSEVEQKISVKERMQKFNRIASESEITTAGLNAKSSTTRSRREIAIKHDSGDFDTASLSSYGYSHVQLDPKSKEWMMTAMKCNYPILNKMAQENPALIRRRDMNYTALHWAAKHGNLECVKLLAGTYKAEVNGKSNGGYTPLHLAAQFGRQEVYDVLIKAYNADPNIRDHSGKKPMQYLVRQDASLSMDTFKKLKEKRRHTEQRERDSSFLRIGSLNVKVKSTRDAFGYFLGKSTSSSTLDKHHKTWGSADNIPEIEENDKDKQMMPPPSGLHKPKHSKRRQKRSTMDPDMIKESRSDSDSDSAFGFGTEWTTSST